jgi:hypothetical protein
VVVLSIIRRVLERENLPVKNAKAPKRGLLNVKEVKEAEAEVEVDVKVVKLVNLQVKVQVNVQVKVQVNVQVKVQVVEADVVNSLVDQNVIQGLKNR